MFQGYDYVIFRQDHGINSYTVYVFRPEHYAEFFRKAVHYNFLYIPTMLVQHAVAIIQIEHSKNSIVSNSLKMRFYNEDSFALLKEVL